MSDDKTCECACCEQKKDYDFGLKNFLKYVKKEAKLEAAELVTGMALCGAAMVAWASEGLQTALPTTSPLIAIGFPLMLSAGVFHTDEYYSTKTTVNIAKSGVLAAMVGIFSTAPVVAMHPENIAAVDTLLISLTVGATAGAALLKSKQIARKESQEKIAEMSADKSKER